MDTKLEDSVVEAVRNWRLRKEQLMRRRREAAEAETPQDRYAALLDDGLFCVTPAHSHRLRDDNTNDAQRGSVELRKWEESLQLREEETAKRETALEEAKCRFDQSMQARLDVVQTTEQLLRESESRAKSREDKIAESELSLRERAAVLAKRTEDLATERQALKTECRDLHGLQAAVQADREEHEREIHLLKFNSSTVNERESEAALRERLLNESLRDLQESQLRHKQREAELDLRESKLAKQQAELDRLAAEFGASESRQSEATAQLEHAASQLEKREASHTAASELLRKAQESLAADQSELESRRVQFNANLEAYETKLIELNSTQAVWNEQCENLAQREAVYEENRRKLKNNQARFEQFAEGVEQQAARNERLTAKLRRKSVGASVDQQQSEIAEQFAQLVQMREEVAAKREALQHEKTNSEEERERYVSRLAKLTADGTAMRTIEAELKSREVALRENERLLNETRSRLRQHEAEREQQSARFEKWAIELSDRESRVATDEARLAVALAEHEQLNEGVERDRKQ